MFSPLILSPVHTFFYKGSTIGIIFWPIFLTCLIFIYYWKKRLLLYVLALNCNWLLSWGFFFCWIINLDYGLGHSSLKLHGSAKCAIVLSKFNHSEHWCYQLSTQMWAIGGNMYGDFGRFRSPFLYPYLVKLLLCHLIMHCYILIVFSVVFFLQTIRACAMLCF